MSTKAWIMRARQLVMRRIPLVSGVIILLFATLVFAEKPSKTTDVYNENNSSIIVYANHPEFTIQLKSNPTTGYTWFLRDYDAKLLTPVGHEFIAADTKLVGAPGYEIWKFRLKPAAFIVPQQTLVRFVYSRPWSAMENATQVVFRVSTQAKQ